MIAATTIGPATICSETTICGDSTVVDDGPVTIPETDGSLTLVPAD